MSTWKVMKAILGAQIVWLIIGSIIFFILSFTNKINKTNNGFYTKKMEKIYNYYKEKQKSTV